MTPEDTRDLLTNPFISCRLDSEGGKAREGKGRQETGRALCWEHPNTTDNSEGGREGRRDEAWSLHFHPYSKSNVPAAFLQLFLSWLQENMSQGSRCSFQLTHSLTSTTLVQDSLQRPLSIIKAAFFSVTNHKRLENDAVISHATVQSQLQQPGLKTRQGLSYLLNSDLDQSGGLDSAKEATSYGDITETMLWMLRHCLKRGSKTELWQTYVYISGIFVRWLHTRGENF